MAASYVGVVASGVAGAKGTTVTAAVSAATTAGNAIVVGCSNSQTSGTFSCTDSKGNSYTLVRTEQHSSATAAHAIFVARNATPLTAADTITVTVSATSGIPALEAFEYAGISGDADAQIGAEGGSNAAYDTGAGTVPSGDHLLFSWATGTGNRTFTPTGSGTWTTLPRTPNPSSTIRTGNPFHQLVTGGGTLENVGTIDANANWVVSAVAFPAASAAPPASGSASGSHTWAGTASGTAPASGGTTSAWSAAVSGTTSPAVSDWSAAVSGTTGSGGAGGTFVFAMTGTPDGTSCPVRVRTSGASSVQLKVATDAALTTGVTFTAGVAPDGSGYTYHHITGLTAGTTYYYAAQVDGVLASDVGSFTTDSPGAARGFRIAFGSCLTSANSNATAFDNMLANAPELFIHLGDWHYDNDLTSSQAAHQASLEAAVNGNTGLRNLIREVPLAYAWSDHDSGNNDWTGGPASWTPSYNAAYREVIPVADTLPAGGIYRSFHRGRVKFILTDSRSFKSPASATDDASKTVFGFTQEDWIASELADAAYPVKVICLDTPWVFATTAGSDKWGGYTAAAQRLVDAIASAGAHVFLIHGDSHFLCADDGSSANNRGSLPVAGAAPFGNSTSSKGGPYSQGTWPNPTGSTEEQHGLLDITDDGSTITVRFSGRDTSNTERVTLSQSYAAPSTTASGSATGAHAWAGSASGSAQHEGTAGGSTTWAGSAAGSTQRRGSATGATAWAGSATGSTEHSGAASGSTAWVGTASGIAPSINPKAATLVDAFAALDASTWTFAANASDVGGQLVLSTSVTYQGAASTGRYDLTDSSIFVEVPQVTNATDGTADTYFILALDDQNNVSFCKEGALLYLGYTLAGAYTSVAIPSYDPVGHRWWKLSESAGVITYSASADGLAWTDLATWTPTLSTTGLQVQLQTGDRGGQANPGAAIFDNLNASPRSGSAAGSHAWTGSAGGTAPIVGAHQGGASGSWTFTGTADGVTKRSGSAAGTWSFAGSAFGANSAALSQLTHPITAAWDTDGLGTGAFDTADPGYAAAFDSDGAGTAAFDTDGLGTGAFDTADPGYAAAFDSDGAGTAAFDTDGVGTATYA